MTSLNISNNSLGGYYDDENEWVSDMSGVQAFAAAIGSGAIANLTTHLLDGNPGNNEPAMKAHRDRTGTARLNPFITFTKLEGEECDQVDEA